MRVCQLCPEPSRANNHRYIIFNSKPDMRHTRRTPAGRPPGRAQSKDRCGSVAARAVLLDGATIMHCPLRVLACLRGNPTKLEVAGITRYVVQSHANKVKQPVAPHCDHPDPFFLSISTIAQTEFIIPGKRKRLHLTIILAVGGGTFFCRPSNWKKKYKACS